jgi:hypothetical protein
VCSEDLKISDVIPYVIMESRSKPLSRQEVLNILNDSDQHLINEGNENE